MSSNTSRSAEGTQNSALPFPSPSNGPNPASASTHSSLTEFEPTEVYAMAPLEALPGIALPNLDQDYGPEMFHLLVGPRQQHFEIHRQLLNDRSLKFRRLFVTQPNLTGFSLPDIDPATFLKIHQWLYYGNTKSIAQEIVLGHLNCGRIGTREMIEAYIVAYKLEITSLEDLAIELLGNGYYRGGLYPSMEDIELAYTETSPGSALRVYMVRQFLHMVLTSTAGPSLDELDRLLSRQPLIAMDFVLNSQGVLTRRLSRTEVLTICEFHNHPRGEQCPTGHHSFNCINYTPGGCNVPDIVDPVVGVRQRVPRAAATIAASSAHGAAVQIASAPPAPAVPAPAVRRR